MEYSVIFQDKATGEICDLLHYQGDSSEYTLNHSHDCLVDCDEDAIIEKTTCTLPMEFSKPELDNLSATRLYPVIVMDENRVILMYAFANKDALEQTAKTELAWYFSRSRNKQWQKGETSGHVQNVRKILFQKERD